VIAVDGHLYAAVTEPYITVSKKHIPGTMVREIVVETHHSSLTWSRTLIEDVLPITEFDIALELATRDDVGSVNRLMLESRRPRDILDGAFGFDYKKLLRVTARIDEAIEIMKRTTRSERGTAISALPYRRST
jgi:hypothetical protein